MSQEHDYNIIALEVVHEDKISEGEPSENDPSIQEGKKKIITRLIKKMDRRLNNLLEKEQGELVQFDWQQMPTVETSFIKEKQAVYGAGTASALVIIKREAL